MTQENERDTEKVQDTEIAQEEVPELDRDVLSVIFTILFKAGNAGNGNNFKGSWYCGYWRSVNDRSRDAKKYFKVTRQVCTTWRAVADFVFRFELDDIMMMISNNSPLHSIKFAVELHPTKWGTRPLEECIKKQYELAGLLFTKESTPQELAKLFFSSLSGDCIAIAKRVIEDTEFPNPIKKVVPLHQTLDLVMERNLPQFINYVLYVQKKINFRITSGKLTLLLKNAIRHNRSEIAELLLKHPSATAIHRKMVLKMCVERNTSPSVALKCLESFNSNGFDLASIERYLTYVVRWGDTEMLNSFLQWGQFPMDNREFLMKSTNNPAKRDMLLNYQSPVKANNYVGSLARLSLPLNIPKLDLNSSIISEGASTPRSKSCNSTPKKQNVFERLYTPRKSTPRDL